MTSTMFSLFRGARLLACAVPLAASSLLPGGALAQPAAASAPTPAAPYPSRPIRIIVPFAPSSAADASIRRLAPGLTKALGQPIVIESKAGAAGIIGSDYVSKAAPDGYTLGVGTLSTHALNVGTYRSLPYDPVDGFVPISRTNSFPNVLVVSPALGVSTMKALIEKARHAPQPLTYASGGAGTTPHLAGEMLATAGKVRLLHVPYRDTGTYLSDVIAGRVDMVFVAIPAIVQHVQTGRLKALAVAGEERSSLLPQVPTMAEAGVQDMNLNIWVGLFAPRGTPPDIARTLNAAVRSALDTDEVRQNFLVAGSKAESDASPADFAQFLKADIPRWLAVVRAAGVSPE